MSGAESWKFRGFVDSSSSFFDTLSFFWRCFVTVGGLLLFGFSFFLFFALCLGVYCVAFFRKINGRFGCLSHFFGFLLSGTPLLFRLFFFSYINFSLCVRVRVVFLSTSHIQNTRKI